MKALIDLDSIVYQYADMKFPDGNQMPAYIAESYCLGKIEEIIERSGSDSWKGFLTFGPDNFRIKLATIKPYKGNRVREKPPLYDHLRGFLSDLPNVHMVFGMEADDACSIEQYKMLTVSETPHIGDKLLYNTIICTLDKDLDMVPGWHYRWGKGDVREIKPWFQTEINGLRCFYKQLLLGDVSDNIHGVYGIGPKSSYLASLSCMDNEKDLFEHVRSIYKKWYGSYGDQFLLENGRLLWMKRTLEDMWEFPYE